MKGNSLLSSNNFRTSNYLHPVTRFLNISRNDIESTLAFLIAFTVFFLGDRHVSSRGGFGADDAVVGLCIGFVSMRIIYTLLYSIGNSFRIVPWALGIILTLLLGVIGLQQVEGES